MEANTNISFEESLARIREMVTELESGDLSLEDSIQRFRDASSLLDTARKLIADAELRVRVLTDDDASDETDEKHG